MIIIKLGGSVITKKDSYATMNKEISASLAKELSEIPRGESLAVIHGAGSFGHMKAKEYNLKNPDKSPNLDMHIAEVQKDVRSLNQNLVEKFIQEGIPAVSVPPAVISRMKEGELEKFDVGVFREYFSLGLVPVSFGDVVLDWERGVTILSGDTIMERLAGEFPVSKVIFILDVDGYYDRPPSEKDSRLYGKLNTKQLKEVLGKESGISKIPRGVVDVTGSMRGKMESALKIAQSGVDVYLVNGKISGRLNDILKGKPNIYTLIKGEKNDN